MPRKPATSQRDIYNIARTCGVCKRKTVTLIPEFWYEHLKLDPKGLCYDCARKNYISTGNEYEILNMSMLKERKIELPAPSTYVGIINWNMGQLKGCFYLVKDGKVIKK